MPPRFHPFFRLLLCALGLVGVSVFLFAVLFAGDFLSRAFTEAPPRESFEEMIRRFQLPLTLLSYPAMLVVIGLCRAKLDRASFLSLGLRPIGVWSNLWRGALCGVLGVAFLFGVLWLCGALVVEGYSPDFFENPVAALLPLFGYFAAFCAVATFEEILFRGYVLHNFNAWFGWRGAVVGSSILFALVHLGNVFESDAATIRAALWALPSLFLIGVFFAVSYRKTGGLWFAIAFHTLWNFALGPLFSLPVSGIETFKILAVSADANNILSGGAFGAEGSIFLPFILGAAIYFLRFAPDHPQAALDLALLHRTETAPKPAPPIAEEPEEIEEIALPNRFQTRFGSAEGFDSQTLRELRELQNQRKTQNSAPPTPPLEVVAAPQQVEEPEKQVKVTQEVANVSGLEVKEPEKQVRMEEKQVGAPDLEVRVEEKQVRTPEKQVGETVQTVEEPKIEVEKPKKKPSPRW